MDCLVNSFIIYGIGLLFISLFLPHLEILFTLVNDQNITNFIVSATCFNFHGVICIQFYMIFLL